MRKTEEYRKGILRDWIHLFPLLGLHSRGVPHGWVYKECSVLLPPIPIVFFSAVYVFAPRPISVLVGFQWQPLPTVRLPTRVTGNATIAFGEGKIGLVSRKQRHIPRGDPLGRRSFTVRFSPAVSPDPSSLGKQNIAADTDTRCWPRAWLRVTVHLKQSSINIILSGFTKYQWWKFVLGSPHAYLFPRQKLSNYLVPAGTPEW